MGAPMVPVELPAVLVLIRLHRQLLPLQRRAKPEPREAEVRFLLPPSQRCLPQPSLAARRRGRTFRLPMPPRQPSGSSGRLNSLFNGGTSRLRRRRHSRPTTRCYRTRKAILRAGNLVGSLREFLMLQGEGRDRQMLCLPGLSEVITRRGWSSQLKARSSYK